MQMNFILRFSPDDEQVNGHGFQDPRPLNFDCHCLSSFELSLVDLPQ